MKKFFFLLYVNNLIFLRFDYSLLLCFISPLSTAGGVLHFHPDNMCSEDRDKVSSEHDACSICSSPALNTLVSSFIFHTYFTSANFFWSLSLFWHLVVQMEDSPSPKRQRLAQQSMLDLSSAPPSTPSSPIRPWELPPSRRPHPHYMPERCHTPLRNRRR